MKSRDKRTKPHNNINKDATGTTTTNAIPAKRDATPRKTERNESGGAKSKALNNPAKKKKRNSFADYSRGRSFSLLPKNPKWNGKRLLLSPARGAANSSY